MRGWPRIACSLGHCGPADRGLVAAPHRQGDALWRDGGAGGHSRPGYRRAVAAGQRWCRCRRMACRVGLCRISGAAPGRLARRDKIGGSFGGGRAARRCHRRRRRQPCRLWRGARCLLKAHDILGVQPELLLSNGLFDRVHVADRLGLYVRPGFAAAGRRREARRGAAAYSRRRAAAPVPPTIGPSCSN